MNLIITAIGTIADLEEDLILLSDSQEVISLKEHFGNAQELEDFDSFFVSISDGDYTKIYGFNGLVPHLTKTVYEITNT